MSLVEGLQKVSKGSNRRGLVDAIRWHKFYFRNLQISLPEIWLYIRRHPPFPLQRRPDEESAKLRLFRVGIVNRCFYRLVLFYSGHFLLETFCNFKLVLLPISLI